MALTVTILTQSADYVMLGMDDTNSIDTPDGISVEEIEGVNQGCLSASSFTWYGLTLSLFLSSPLSVCCP